MYKSKDLDYMNRLKKSIYRTKELDKVNKEFVWLHMKKHIQLEDLRTYAITQLPGHIIQLGIGNYNVPIVIISKIVFTKEEFEFLDKALESVNLSRQDVYCTPSIKTEIELPSNVIYNNITDAEIRIINPKTVFIIGECNFLANNEIPAEYSSVSLADCLIEDNDILQKKNKTIFWKALQKVMRHVNAN